MSQGKFVLDGQQLKSDRAQTLLRSFKTLRASNFAAPDAATKLSQADAPASIRFELSSGKTHTMWVGAVPQDAYRYVIADDDPTVYIVSAFLADWAFYDRAKFGP